MSLTQYPQSRYMGQQLQYPKNLNGIQNAYDKHSWSGYLLKEAVKKVDGFCAETRYPTCSLKLQWFWGFHFSKSGNSMTILFPWAQDWEEKDGSRCDRAIAIAGVIQDDILHELAAAMEEVAREREKVI